LSIVGKETAVDLIHDRVAGWMFTATVLSRACVGSARRGGVVREKGRFTTTTAGLRELEEWLADRQVELVAMEASGVYWKPVLYALESRFTVWLCNARNVKKLPGAQDGSHRCRVAG
jgi:transposase